MYSSNRSFIYSFLSVLGHWRTSVKALKSFSSTDPVSSKPQGPLGKIKKFLKMEAVISVRF